MNFLRDYQFLKKKFIQRDNIKPPRDCRRDPGYFFETIKEPK